MLKIKEKHEDGTPINLEELENFGFEYNEIEKYWFVYNYNEWYISILVYENKDILVVDNIGFNILYDLIKADMVKKTVA